VAETNIRLRVDASDAVSQLNRVNGSVKSLSSNFGRLQSATSKFQSVIASVGLALVAKQAVSAAASFNDLQTRLKLLTSEYGEYEQAQALVAKSAKTFGLSNREAAEGITDIFARLRPLGVSLRDIESTYVGFNAVAKLSGVNAVQAGAAFTQLAQALGSGALRGDEFNSISEQVPGLLTAISQETGVAQGSLRDYAAQGKITSETVIGALKRIEKEGGDKIKKLIEESDVQRFKDFSNASDALSVSIGQKLLPAITPLIKAATNAVETFAKLPKPIQDSTIAVFALAGALGVLTPAISFASGTITTMAGGAVIGSAIKGLAAMGEASIAAAAGKNVLAASVTAANAQITIATVSAGLLKAALIALPFVAVAGFAYLFVDAIIKANTEQAEFNKVLETGTRKQLEAALAIEKTNLARSRSFQLQGRGAGRAAFQAPIEEAERRIAQLQAQLLGVGVVDPKTTEIVPIKPPITAGEGSGAKGPQDISPDMEALLLKQQQLRFSNDELAKSTIEKNIQILDILESQSQPRERNVALIKAENDALFRTASIFADNFKQADQINKKIIDGNLAGVKAGFAAGKAADEQISKLTETEKLANSIGAQLGTGITDALVGAVKGTKDLGEAFQELASDILEAVGKALILKAVTAAIGSVGGGGGDDAGSGLLGLLFREKGGPVSANQPYVVGESGPELFVPGASGSITNNQQFEAARASMSFYGGGGGTPAYSPNIQATTMPDGMQYVTVEQMNSTVQAGMKVAANQGAAGGQSRTMNALRNSRSQRSKIGLGR